MTDAAAASRQASRSLVAAATMEQGRPFVGRVQELRELRAALEEAATRRGCLLLVTGEPGIGKSRLMEELARQLAKQSWWVLVGRCWEHGGAPAYWPWIQVVRAAGSELEACFPGTPPAADPEAARFLLFDEVGRFLRKVAGAGPVLVVLDDLHAADEPSLLLLRFLAQTVADERVVLVGAYRDAEPRVHELSDLFGDLARVGRRVPLRGLSRAEVGAYMLRVAGRSPPEAVVARVHDVTAGNPLFLGEVVRALVAGGNLGTAEGQVTEPMLRIPEELRGLIRRRLVGLSTEAVSNLKVASVIGREFELGVLQRISRLGVGRLTDALAEAVTAGIVSEDTLPPGRYAFSHELVREALYDDLPAGRRLKLHRIIGLALKEAFREDLEPHFAELAHHFTRSATLGTRPWPSSTAPVPVTTPRRCSPTRMPPGTTRGPCTCCRCSRTQAATGAAGCCCAWVMSNGGPGTPTRPGGASRRRPLSRIGWTRRRRWPAPPLGMSPLVPPSGSGWVG